MKPWEKRNRQRQNEREFCPAAPQPMICKCGHDIDEHALEPSLGGKCSRVGCDCKEWIGGKPVGRMGQ